MNNEFYEHKRSDAVKWVIVFVLIAGGGFGICRSECRRISENKSAT